TVWKDLQKQIDRLDVEIGRLLQTFSDAPQREDAPVEAEEQTDTDKKKDDKKRGRRAPARTMSRRA
ncbi:MAG: hypothetical protein IJS59_04395, partial [Bacteroidaceae bacterium]|nr:hypothetical protein [Bacteroidaceae bacterium]